jgi:hypothetical protein
MPARGIVGQFLQSFQEFPPSQKPGSSGIGKALEAIRAASQSGGREPQWLARDGERAGCYRVRSPTSLCEPTRGAQMS